MGKKSLIIIYTGNGKGKTSAALGLLTRALRENMKVVMVQFIKSRKMSGEVSLNSILPKLKVKCFGTGFVYKKLKAKEMASLREVIHKGIEFSKKIVKSKKYEVIILDEIFVAYNLKLIKISDIVEIMKEAHRIKKKMFLVLTGRGCPKSLYKYADLVTEMKEIKHPFQKGIMAIKGIDF